LTELKRPGRLQLVRRYAAREHQPEVLPRGIEAVVEADIGAEGRADALERHAAEFARPGGADQVRGDLKQHGLPLRVPARCIFGTPSLAQPDAANVVRFPPVPTEAQGHVVHPCPINS